jgi:hypothetical protein
MPNTTNYSFPTPADTDLVKNGADAIRDLGDAVDTAMNTALGTKKAGMVLLNTTSFSGVASQAVNGVFNSSYDNYRIILRLSAYGTDGVSYMKLRSGVTDNSSTEYTTTGFYATASSSVGETLNNQSTGFITMVGDAGTSGLYYTSVFEIFDPFVASATGWQSMMRGYLTSGATWSANYYGFHALGNSYDGFNLIFPGNNSGKVTVYGYNK